MVLRGLTPLVGGSETFFVGKRRITANPVVILHASLGGQAVIVPAHGVEDFLAAHALIARLQVHVGVAEDVTDMEASRRGGWGSVDREDTLRAAFYTAFAVEAISARVFPRRGPFGF